MPSVPDLQVLYRRREDILFGWKPLKRSEAKSYNLYAASSSGGAYSLVKSNILNEIDKSVYRGKVVVYVKDADIPIPLNKSIPPEIGGVVDGTNYWFKLTFVDPSNVESNIASSPAIIVRPWNEEPFFENENEVQNDHLYAWVKSRRRWEKVLLNDDGKLVVDAEFTGTITVGDVKIDPNSVERFSDYEETTNIAKNIETTILTYTKAEDYFIEKVVCSGTADGVYKLKVDGTTERTIRTAWNDRNATFDYSTWAKIISSGSTVTITVTHTERDNQNFEASLEGYVSNI